MSQDLLRNVENIARNKNIDKESIFQDLESAIVSAAQTFCRRAGQRNRRSY